jgi:hypothetical protein
MVRIAQVGIALGALGMIMTFMGLFPGSTGVDPTPRIGILQMVFILLGFTLLIFGALLYAKFTFYSNMPSTLIQQIATRLALTGILFAALSGMADILGFGTHTRAAAADVFIGPLQAVGVIGNFLLSSFGVLLYTLSGEPKQNQQNPQ